MTPDNETNPQEATNLDAFIVAHPFAQVSLLRLWIEDKRDLYQSAVIQSAHAENVALGLLDALERFLEATE